VIYNVKGLDDLSISINRFMRIKSKMDNACSLVAGLASGELARDTPKMTGTIARQWSTPSKIGDLKYEINNKATTKDGNHSLIEILDKGRKTVYPVRAKRLYIPLTDKGRSKKEGQKPGEDFQYGVDYIYAKKSKATKPLNFIEPIIEKSSQRLQDEIVKLINV